MLDWFLIFLTIALSGGAQTEDRTMIAQTGASAVGTPGRVAAPQTPTGQFTTATEIRPILDMTRAHWIALSAQPGNDFLYVTHIWSWRCGMYEMKIGLNGAPMEVLPLPPCHEGTTAPNAIKDSDGLPFRIFPADEIESVEVELLLNDLSVMSHSYMRSDIMMP